MLQATVEGVVTPGDWSSFDFSKIDAKAFSAPTVEQKRRLSEIRDRTGEATSKLVRDLAREKEIQDFVKLAQKLGIAPINGTHWILMVDGKEITIPAPNGLGKESV